MLHVQLCFQEQYKTIFLTLYEMYKAPAIVQNTTEFIEKLEKAKIDTTANVSFFRDEFQVKIFLFFFCIFFFKIPHMQLKYKTNLKILLFLLSSNRVFQKVFS